MADTSPLPGVSDSTPGLASPLANATPEQIRSLYLHALALRQHPGGITDPRGWAGGLGYGLEHAGANFGAAMLENRAAQMSAQQREAMAEAADPTGGAASGAASGATTGPRSDAGDSTAPEPPQALGTAFNATEQKYGLPPGYLKNTAWIESRYNPSSHNELSGASGLFQFVPSTARQYGLNPRDPMASTDAAGRLARDNADSLKRVLGRDPTAGELYLAHQQGAHGAASLLSNPNAPASSLVGGPAVTQNGGHPGMTAGQFSNMWTGRFGANTAPVPPTRTASNDPSAALAFNGQPQGSMPSEQQAIATALASPQGAQPPGASKLDANGNEVVSTSFASPGGAATGTLDPRAQYAQAANPQQQPQQSSAMVYQQMISRLIRAGATPEQATSMAQHQMGLLPKYDMQNGLMYKTQPGAPPQFVGPVPGYRDIQPAPGGLPGYTERYYDSSGQMHMRVVPMDTETGARGAAAPASASARPGAPAPSGGQTTAIPPMPTGPGTTLQDLQNWQAQKDAATKGLTKQAEESAGGLAKMQVEQVGEDAKKGDLASKSIQYLRTMRELSHVPDAASINSGPHASDFLKVKEFVKDMTGYDAGGIATAEGIDKMNGYLASAAAKELTNRPTQFDFRTFLERNPGLTVSQEGRDLLMDALESSFKQDQAVSNAARKVKSADLENWPEIRQKVIDANPIQFSYRGQKLTTADKIPELQNAAPPPAAAAPAPTGGVPPGKYTWDPKTRKAVPVQ